MRLLTSLFIAVVFGFIINQGVPAEEHGHRQHGAHEHGAGQLNVAVEGKTLHIELISPAVNIVGFEHEPKDHHKKEAVREVVKILKDSARMFGFNPEAGCRPSMAEVGTDILGDHEGDEHEDGHHGHDEDSHSEFHAAYEFACSSPEKLKYVDVKVFDLFKGMEELDAQIIGPKGQSAQELTHGSSRIRF